MAKPMRSTGLRMLGGHGSARYTWLTLVCVSVTACNVSLPGFGVRGSGVEATERRDVAAFDAVAAGGDLDVRVGVGPERSVTLTGDDNLLPLIRTEVRGSTLHLEPERDLDARRRIRVAVTTPRLKALSVSGSGNAETRGFSGDVFSARVAGSGNMLARGEARALNVAVSGSGNVQMSGGAESVTADVSGSGNLDLRDVRARSARVRVSGSGDVLVSAAEELDASVSGSGNIRYLGKPRVTRSVSGSGSVEPEHARESSLDEPEQGRERGLAEAVETAGA